MESDNKKIEHLAPLYLFGFIGLSCYACCALFSLLIGIGWLLTSTNYIFNFSWEYLILIGLILWGVLPIVGFYFYLKRKK